MKHVLLTLPIIFCFFSCTDEEIILTKGEYRIKKLLYFSDQYSGHPHSYRTYDYDRSGRVIKESFFEYPSLLLFYDTYEYISGRLHKKTSYAGQSGNPQPGSYVIYEYQEDHLTGESFYYYNGDLHTSRHYEYSDGKLVHTWSSEPGGLEHTHTYYFYNSPGNLVVETSSPDGLNIDNIINYYYDDLNRLFRKEQETGDSTLLWAEEYLYSDNHSSDSVVIQYNLDGDITYEYHYEFNTDGNLLSAYGIMAGEIRPLLHNTWMGDLLIEERRYFFPWVGLFPLTYQLSSGWHVTRYEYQKIN
ncbi:MAG TPA: hypothetical protein VI583_03865 [Cyclobacteriaceae bacterium]|nr:hypothetical protein [Cyclobacteriaceae bacterium]